MELGIEKCAKLIMKSEKQQIMEEIGLPNQQKIRPFGEKQNYRYLGLLDADTIRHAKIKEKKSKEYHRRMKKYSKPNYIVVIRLKGYIPGLSRS